MMDLDTAQRKARYGHKDWLSWKDDNGNIRYEVMTVASLEKAIQESNGRNFTLIAANSAHLHITTPEIAQIMLNNARYGIL